MASVRRVTLVMSSKLFTDGKGFQLNEGGKEYVDYLFNVYLRRHNTKGSQ